MKIQRSLAFATFAAGTLVALTAAGCQGRSGKKVSTEQSAACPGGAARVDGKCAPAAQQPPAGQQPPSDYPPVGGDDSGGGGVDTDLGADGQPPLDDSGTTDTAGQDSFGGSQSDGLGGDGLYVPPGSTDDDLPYTPGTGSNTGGSGTGWNGGSGTGSGTGTGWNGGTGSGTGTGWNSGSGSGNGTGGFGTGTGNGTGNWNSGNGGIGSNGNTGLGNNGLGTGGTNVDLREGATTRFLTSAPTTRARGAPHVKLVAVIRDRKIQVLTSFSHVESVTDVTYSYGKEKFDPNGRTDVSTGIYTAQNVRIPLTIKFTFDGRACSVTTTAPFAEDTLTPTCG